MARTKSYNPNMGDLIEAVQEYRQNGATIRAKYAALAEAEIAKSRDRVLDLMFIKHAESGPSEIANTTGISRTTVVRWRREFLEKSAGDDWVESVISAPEPELESPPVKRVAHDLVPIEYEFGTERSQEANIDVARVVYGDESVYLFAFDLFGFGETVDEAEYNTGDRPEWLTDEIIHQAAEVTGASIPFLPKRK